MSRAVACEDCDRHGTHVAEGLRIPRCEVTSVGKARCARDPKRDAGELTFAAIRRPRSRPSWRVADAAPTITARSRMPAATTTSAVATRRSGRTFPTGSCSRPGPGSRSPTKSAAPFTTTKPERPSTTGRPNSRSAVSPAWRRDCGAGNARREPAPQLRSVSSLDAALSDRGRCGFSPCLRLGPFGTKVPSPSIDGLCLEAAGGVMMVACVPRSRARR